MTQRPPPPPNSSDAQASTPCFAVLKRRGLRASGSRRMIIGILIEATRSRCRPARSRVGPDGNRGSAWTSRRSTATSRSSPRTGWSTRSTPGEARAAMCSRAAARASTSPAADCGATVDVDPGRARWASGGQRVRERFGFKVSFPRRADGRPLRAGCAAGGSASAGVLSGYSQKSCQPSQPRTGDRERVGRGDPLNSQSAGRDGLHGPEPGGAPA